MSKPESNLNLRSFVLGVVAKFDVNGQNGIKTLLSKTMTIPIHECKSREQEHGIIKIQMKSFDDSLNHFIKQATVQEKEMFVTYVKYIDEMVTQLLEKNENNTS